jgi:hypothetical protein
VGGKVPRCAIAERVLGALEEEGETAIAASKPTISTRTHTHTPPLHSM